MNSTVNPETTVIIPRSAPPTDNDDVTVRLRIPHAMQLKFMRSPAKRKIIRAGRRGGKTTGVAIYAVENFLKGVRVLYATPTADQINRFWSEVKTALAEPIERGLYKKNETEHYIELAGTEQRIRAKTAWNADTLRGDYADILIMDEFQLMNESAWADVGAPMLIDNNGDAVFIYTPPSLHTKAVSKARDLRHASKMYKRAKEQMVKAEAAGEQSRWEAFHFTSHDNPYVSAEGIAEIVLDMSSLSYRQEIMAEDIDEVPGALWTRQMIDDTRVTVLPPMKRMIVGVDPSGASNNEAGVVLAGVGYDNHAYVIEDASLLAPSSHAWAAAAVRLYHDHRADRVVGERNYGGDMVEATVRTIDENVSYYDVEATRGKLVRAEPVSALYERGVAHHVGPFPQLEEEMVSYVPGTSRSPNRMDAMVWALTELMLGSSTLGLLDYVKQGQAAAELSRMRDKARTTPDPTVTLPHKPAALPSPVDAPTDPDPVVVTKAAGASTLGKVVVNDSTPACPECGSNLLQDIAGGQKRCGQCGVQWGSKPSTPQQTRTDALAKMQGRGSGGTGTGTFGRFGR